MKVLLTGANGFIGSHITRNLLNARHIVTPAVRHDVELRCRFPAVAKTFFVDMNKATKSSDWIGAVKNQDAVINCAGILQATASQNIWNIHARSPTALFEACEKTKVRRVVQISAISADMEAGTEYALSKLAADNDLRARKLDWVVLRPSLVVASNAYGSTALLWRLANLPYAIPLVGKGDQLFQPIAIDDLCKVVLASLKRPEMKQVTMDVVGPDILTMKDILLKLRSWFGKPPARFVEIPADLVKVAALVADVFAAGPMRTTALKHLIYGNAGGNNALERMERLAGVRPQTLDGFLQTYAPGTIGR